MATRLLIFLLLAGAIIGPGDLSSCGPFFPATEFTKDLAPLDEARYFGGDIGILEPRYFRIYLMAAYRYLAGVGLSAEDQRTLVAKPSPQDYPWLAYTGSPAVKEWLRVRAQVSGAPRLDRIDRFKTYGENVYVLNCGDDAFRSAAQTLVARSRSGASSDTLKDWLAAQDQVFANCSSPPPWERRAKPAEPSIPAMLPESAAALPRDDRAYQIAAAEFYAGQFDKAATDFRRIAENRASPWHGIAPYLAARALIRKTTLVDFRAAPDAQEQLKKALADPDTGPWYESARGLMRYLRAQTEPERVLNEVARAVAKEKSGVAAQMNDYRLLLDRYLDRGKRAPLDEDITQWIVTMQQGGSPLDRWRATRSLPWLAAALTWAGEPDAEMMRAAAQVPERSPAYLTVTFHSLRLMPPAEARPGLDAILSRKIPPSDRNLFLAARMRLARDWDELLRYAPRTAVDAEQPTGVPRRYLDQDAARILDRQATRSVLRRAAVSPRLPPNLQLEIALAVWVRSVLLDDSARAQGVAPVLAALAPDLKQQLRDYVAAPDDRARRFSAAWLMLHNPGVRPSIDPGVPRSTPMAKIDTFRDNWWCAAGPPFPNEPQTEKLNAPLQLLYRDKKPEAAFLTEAEGAAARQERERLASAPAAVTFMARQAVEWAAAHPDNPRAPESLHLAVRAGHYACGGDPESDRWTGRAFRLLHRRYANTEWARQTPYWYKVSGR